MTREEEMLEFADDIETAYDAVNRVRDEVGSNFKRVLEEIGPLNSLWKLSGESKEEGAKIERFDVLYNHGVHEGSFKIKITDVSTPLGRIDDEEGLIPGHPHYLRPLTSETTRDLHPKAFEFMKAYRVDSIENPDNYRARTA